MLNMKAGVTTGRRVRRGNTEDHQRLSQQIIQTTFELYRTKGMAELKMRTIAGRVGLSPMGMYRYFPSKGRLLAALVQFVMAELDEQLAAAVERAPPTPRARIQASIEATIAYWEAHTEHYRLVFLTEEATGPDAEPDIAEGPALQAVIERNMGLLRDYAEATGGDPQRARLALDLRRCMVYGYLHQVIVMRAMQVDDVATLRRQMIDSTMLCIDQCLAS